jgi:hypothetical protein
VALNLGTEWETFGDPYLYGRESSGRVLCRATKNAGAPTQAILLVEVEDRVVQSVRTLVDNAPGSSYGGAEFSEFGPDVSLNTGRYVGFTGRLRSNGAMGLFRLDSRDDYAIARMLIGEGTPYNGGTVEAFGWAPKGITRYGVAVVWARLEDGRRFILGLSLDLDR